MRSFHLSTMASKESKLLVDPAETLVFGYGRKTAELKVKNGSDRRRAVKITASNKFNIQSPLFELEAGKEATIAVAFKDDVPGRREQPQTIKIQHIRIADDVSATQGWEQHKGDVEGSCKLTVYFEEKKDEEKKDVKKEEKKEEKKDVKKEEKKDDKKEEKKDVKKEDKKEVKKDVKKEDKKEVKKDDKKEDKKEVKMDEGKRYEAVLEIFDQWRKATIRKGREAIEAEFRSQIKAYLPELWDAGAFIDDQNASKNRYPDIFCLDRSRVVLAPENEGEGDYIHASHVNGPGDTRYICAQGPKEQTVVDFWRMIWQENVGLVIMLCDIEEQRKRKCALYWPRSGQSSFGNFTVVMKQKETVPLAEGQTVVLHKLKVTNSRGEQREIEHYQWTGWPDQSVPDSFSAPIHLVKLMNAFAGRPQPVLVHCSAGVGRTGTLVALHMCLGKLLQREQLNVMEMVKKLRDQRAHCIQTEKQYVFLHCAVESYFMSVGTRRI